jgi:beta-1,4-N-acetylglucosaminyltransferase
MPQSLHLRIGIWLNAIWSVLLWLPQSGHCFRATNSICEPGTSSKVDIVKVAIISSSGGHLTEVRCLRAAFSNYPHIYVLNDQIDLADDMVGRTYFITHAERNWRQLLNFWEAYSILRRERPNVLISTGASPIVPFSLVGRIFFGVRIVFVETITRVETPSLTGKIMYRIAHRFYYQNRSLAKHFPRGSYCGGLI